MGATLIVRDQATWMPREIEFEQALEDIAQELEASNPSMAEMLREPIDKFAFLDLSSLDADRFRELVQATQRTYNRLVVEEAVRSPEPLHYFHVLYRFSQLKALMVSDPRVAGDTRATIVISDGASWQAPAWLCDVVLEAVAAHFTLRPGYPVLAETLLSARGNGGTGHLDLRPIAGGEFCAVLEAVKWTYQYYAVNKVGLSVADDFYAELSPKVEELYGMFQADERSCDCEQEAV